MTGIRTICLFSAALALFSCSGEPGKKEAMPAREIMKTYTDNLAAAPKKAEQAAGAAGARDAAQQRALDELDRPGAEK